MLKIRRVSGSNLQIISSRQRNGNHQLKFHNIFVAIKSMRYRASAELEEIAAQAQKKCSILLAKPQAARFRLGGLNFKRKYRAHKSIGEHCARPAVWLLLNSRHLRRRKHYRKPELYFRIIAEISDVFFFVSATLRHVASSRG